MQHEADIKIKMVTSELRVAMAPCECSRLAMFTRNPNKLWEFRPDSVFVDNHTTTRPMTMIWFTEMSMPKEGEWAYDFVLGLVRYDRNLHLPESVRKVVASSDSEMGLPMIPNYAIRKYIGSPYTKVRVEMQLGYAQQQNGGPDLENYNSYAIANGCLKAVFQDSDEPANMSEYVHVDDVRKLYDGLLQNVGTSVKQADLPSFEQWLADHRSKNDDEHYSFAKGEKVMVSDDSGKTWHVAYYITYSKERRFPYCCTERFDQVDFPDACGLWYHMIKRFK